MSWEVLLIPIIALAVWILSSIFRSVEDEREKNKPRRTPSEGGRLRVPPPQRRPVTDLDRFLEDARRRREAAQPRPPAEATAPRPEPRVERPPERPVPKPAPEAPREPRTARATEWAERTARAESAERADRSRERKSAEPVLMALPVTKVAPPAPLPTVPGGARPAAPPEPGRVPTALPARPVAALGGKASSPSPFLGQLAALLGKRESVGAAIVLHEILGPPLSQRGRGGRG
jgi:hypothetical protein